MFPWSYPSVLAQCGLILYFFCIFLFIAHTGVCMCVTVCMHFTVCVCVCEPASSFHQVCPGKFLYPVALTELPRLGVCRCDRACAIRQRHCFRLIGDKSRLENWCKWRSQIWEEVGFHQWAGRKWVCTFIGDFSFGGSHFTIKLINSFIFKKFFSQVFFQ